MATVKLGDIAIEAKSSNKGDKTGIRIVGLEHLTSSSVTLSSWSEDTENTFTKEFSKGDVLFGRRRAYLKKAAVAPFDGICSGDITVIRAMKDKVDPDLLPFIIQNDYLFDFAVGKSAGSLSPRVKWTHLKEFTIDLPSMSEQSKLAETLWSINETKNAYEDLINKTDELVKSQFIEMFGDVITNEKGWRYELLPNVTQIILGSTPKTTVDEYWDGDLKWVTPSEIEEDTLYISDTNRHITEAGQKNARLTLMPVNTVLFSTRAPIGKTAITASEMYCNQGFKNFVCSSSLDPVFLYCLLKYNTDYFVSLGGGTTFKELPRKIIERISISVPPIDLQNRYSEIYLQSDKSKFALQEAIKDLDALSKKIIAENLILAGKE